MIIKSRFFPLRKEKRKKVSGKRETSFFDEFLPAGFRVFCPKNVPWFFFLGESFSWCPKTDPIFQHACNFVVNAAICNFVNQSFLFPLLLLELNTETFFRAGVRKRKVENCKVLPLLFFFLNGNKGASPKLGLKSVKNFARYHQHFAKTLGHVQQIKN